MNRRWMVTIPEEGRPRPRHTASQAPGSSRACGGVCDQVPLRGHPHPRPWPPGGKPLRVGQWHMTTRLDSWAAGLLLASHPQSCPQSALHTVAQSQVQVGSSRPVLRGHRGPQKLVRGSGWGAEPWRCRLELGHGICGPLIWRPCRAAIFLPAHLLLEPQGRQPRRQGPGGSPAAPSVCMSTHAHITHTPSSTVRSLTCCSNLRHHCPAPRTKLSV